MPCQRAGVTEGLATTLAHMRLLASVNSRMNGKRRSLDELLPTTRMIANMRTNTTVNAFMASEVATSGKPLAAGGAGKGLRKPSAACRVASAVLLPLLLWWLNSLHLGVIGIGLAGMVTVLDHRNLLV